MAPYHDWRQVLALAVRLMPLPNTAGAWQNNLLANILVAWVIRYTLHLSHKDTAQRLWTGAIRRRRVVHSSTLNAMKSVTPVSGILVANESQRKPIPAARHRLATVSRSEVMVNCALTGPNRRVGGNARGSDLWCMPG